MNKVLKIKKLNKELILMAKEHLREIPGIKPPEHISRLLPVGVDPLMGFAAARPFKVGCRVAARIERSLRS
jgi:hypothetical protein